MTTFETTLQIQLSDSCTLDYTYLGNDTITSTASPFTALSGAIDQLYVQVDAYHYKTTIGASMGFQGLSSF